MSTSAARIRGVTNEVSECLDGVHHRGSLVLGLRAPYQPGDTASQSWRRRTGLGAPSYIPVPRLPAPLPPGLTEGVCSMPGPLHELVVIDATWGLPSAAGTLLLADYGAHVVKVERPGGGPDATSVARSAWDRNKRSVELDLSDPQGRSSLHALLAGADVFIHSFPPGRAEELGLGYEALHAQFPTLVCAAVSGYGQSGPLADRPGYDALVAARLGLMAEQPGHRDGPIFSGHQHIAIGTGFLLAIGVLSAIRARRTTGSGQLVDVSLLDSALAQCSMNWWWNESQISYLA
ncbi:MAG: CoA transferase, partial [Frankiales bacterium]|nr:CoA transferase [Frankiales bacterium]